MNEGLYIGEDRDFADRFHDAGIKMAFVPAMSVCHKEREFLPFLKQRYVFSYSVPINLLRGISLKFNLMAMAPIWGLLLFAASGFVFSRLGISFQYLWFFPLSVVLVLLLESLRIGRNFAEAGRALFIFICVYAVWTGAIFFGIFRLPPKPETMYSHK